MTSPTNRTKLATRTSRATWTIITALSLLAFASASGAFAKHLITATEDTVYCKPQRSSSTNLWTCYDYYGNEFKNLKIIQAQ